MPPTLLYVARFPDDIKFHTTIYRTSLPVFGLFDLTLATDWSWHWLKRWSRPEAGFAFLSYPVRAITGKAMGGVGPRAAVAPVVASHRGATNLCPPWTHRRPLPRWWTLAYIRGCSQYFVDGVSKRAFHPLDAWTCCLTRPMALRRHQVRFGSTPHTRAVGHGPYLSREPSHSAEPPDVLRQRKPSIRDTPPG